MVAYTDVVAYEEGTHGCVTVAADRALYGSAVTVSGARVVAAGPGGLPVRSLAAPSVGLIASAARLASSLRTGVGRAWPKKVRQRP